MNCDRELGTHKRMYSTPHYADDEIHNDNKQIQYYASIPGTGTPGIFGEFIAIYDD